MQEAASTVRPFLASPEAAFSNGSSLDTPRASLYTVRMTKGERRGQQRQKRRYGMRVDNAQVRRVQLALIERSRRTGLGSQDRIE